MGLGNPLQTCLSHLNPLALSPIQSSPPLFLLQILSSVHAYMQHIEKGVLQRVRASPNASPDSDLPLHLTRHAFTPARGRRRPIVPLAKSPSDNGQGDLCLDALSIATHLKTLCVVLSPLHRSPFSMELIICATDHSLSTVATLQRRVTRSNQPLSIPTPQHAANVLCVFTL